jgi:hypothetical protein
MLKRILGGIDAVWYVVAGGVAVAGTYLFVFVAPWFKPMPSLPVVSDSQSVGFDNRFALVALAVGMVVLALLALLRRAGAAAASWPGEVVRSSAVPVEERIPKWLVGLAVALIVAETVAVIVIYRGIGFSDSAYFIDRLFYLANGSRLLTEVEYSYGPLLIAPPYLAWLALRGLGVGLGQTYFAFVGVMHVLGLLSAAWVLNRLEMPRMWRGVWFGAISLFTAAIITYGVNYTPLRFLAPAMAILLYLQFGGRSWGRRGAVLVAALFACFAVSPEVGLVAAAGLAGTLFFEGFGPDRRPFLAALAVLLLGAGGWMIYGMAGDSTAGALSAGAYYIPILPGLPAMVFVAMALTAGWGVGNEVALGGWKANAAMLGWFVAAVAFLPAALGRADIVHLFWNGLMLGLIGSAVAWRLSDRAGAVLTAAVTVVFVISVGIFTATGLVPSAYRTAVRAGALTFDDSRYLSRRLRRNDMMGRSWYRANRLFPMKEDDLALLAEKGAVFAPFWINGEVAARLTDKKALLPDFGPPAYSLSRGQVDKGMATLGKAEYVLLPYDEYRNYMQAGAGALQGSGDAMIISRQPATLMMTYYTGFPLIVTPIRPTFDPTAFFGRELRRHWVVVKHSGGYVILRRARPPGSGPLGL